MAPETGSAAPPDRGASAAHALGRRSAGLPGVLRQRPPPASGRTLRDKPFPNDHLDLFFNAVGDAAIALTTCMRAAEAVGLGCCPISELRNHAARVGERLTLPARVIPFADFCIG